jgi:hypothetical protein
MNFFVCFVEPTGKLCFTSSDTRNKELTWAWVAKAFQLAQTGSFLLSSVYNVCSRVSHSSVCPQLSSQHRHQSPPVLPPRRPRSPYSSSLTGRSLPAWPPSLLRGGCPSSRRRRAARMRSTNFFVGLFTFFYRLHGILDLVAWKFPVSASKFSC